MRLVARAGDGLSTIIRLAPIPKSLIWMWTCPPDSSDGLTKCHISQARPPLARRRPGQEAEK